MVCLTILFQSRGFEPYRVVSWPQWADSTPDPLPDFFPSIRHLYPWSQHVLYCEKAGTFRDIKYGIGNGTTSGKHGTMYQFFSCRLCAFVKIFMYAWGKNPKKVSFSRVYVCICKSKTNISNLSINDLKSLYFTVLLKTIQQGSSTLEILFLKHSFCSGVVVL